MDTSSKRILMVDDDVELCQLLAEFLRGVGFVVEAIHDGRQAIDILRDPVPYDAVVLDIMMPHVSGLDVLQTLRREHDIPILMLTGRGDDIDRIVGLELGADDYLGKPCNPRELAARLNAILRRAKKPHDAPDGERVLSHFGLQLNQGTLCVRFRGENIEFTSAEFRVLQLLMRHAGQTLSKEFLTRQVLHRDLTAHDRSIDVHISRVRQKLARHAGLTAVIRAVRGLGYQLVVEE